MKKRYYKILATMSLLLGVLVVVSCDNVSDPVEEDKILTENTVRVKEFESTVSTQQIELDSTVTFVDLSSGVDDRKWTFEGGDPSASKEDGVAVTFDEVGVKNCSLEILFFDGSIETKNYEITVVKPFNANFSFTPEDFSPGQAVQFTDKTFQDPDGWSWNFPGGTPATSTEQNPTVTWAELSDRYVTLTVTRSSDGKTDTYKKLIDVAPFNLWTSDIQGFELGNSVDSWITWNSSEGAVWPEGTLTTVEDAANNSGRAAKIIYNGEGNGNYWGMITRNPIDLNAQITENKKYRFSFWVKADQPDTLGYVRIVNLVEDWFSGLDTPLQAWYGTGVSDVPVTTDWVYHEKEITVNFNSLDGYDDGIGYNTFPEIGFTSANPNVYYVDEIKLEQID